MIDTLMETRGHDREAAENGLRGGESISFEGKYAA